MRNIVKTFVILPIIALIPGAMAATSRVSVTNNAASRLPSIAGRLVTGTTTGTTTTTSSTAAYYGDSECIEQYTDCIKGDDVCGSDMQECTTNVLFHGQMANCLSVLYQCSSSGVNALFGTSSISALSDYSASDTKTEDGVTEVTRYIYPKDGSVLGQLIIGASITNKLTTEQCVRRYTNCLQRDDICGSDFELCTDNKSFKKQAMLCDSTLQRCQNDGKKELFGSVSAAGNLRPESGSGDTAPRLRVLIDDGASLAALNAVKTCQKVTDNCLISACTKNPLRCVEGINLATIGAADFVSGSSDTTLAGLTSSTQNLTGATVNAGTGAVIGGSEYNDNYLYSLTGSDIRKMLKAQCLETIGSNRYCHMTYREKVPSNKDLVDIDLQEDVFSLAYAARKDAVNTKIQEAVKKFDTKSKNACVDTIKSCAMRSCGGGLGSVCYTRARIDSGDRSATSKDVSIHVNGKKTYSDIYAGCSAIVNADANCIYAAMSTSSDDSNKYTYTYYDDSEDSAFNRLFPSYSESARDPIGAVATLNSLLATSYNDAAIEKMKKQCQTVALSCVKSMCGKDYVNCYRNRTDIIAEGTYSTGSAKFDSSMNKVGGVLDYNIVIGLCMDTVKNSAVCEEHLKIATATWRNKDYRDSESWGGSGSVREAWLDSNTTKWAQDNYMNDVVIACASNDKDCAGTTMEPKDDDCIGVEDTITDGDGNTKSCIYDQKITISESEYVLRNAATTMFQTLLADEEMKVQQLYNSKLTKEQNICKSNSNGGVRGRNDTGSTFMWVKLRNSKVPNDYQTNGLKANKFVETGDLYGAFCRARITVQSDDKDIQDLLTKNGGSSVAYFAVGDSFTCGSWISNATLQKISEKVGEREVCKAGYGTWKDGECDTNIMSLKEKLAYTWGTVAPALVGLGGGMALTESGLIGGLVNNANAKNSNLTTQKQNKQRCVSSASYASANASSNVTLAQSYLNTASEYCKKVTNATNTLCNVSDAAKVALTADGSNKDAIAKAIQDNATAIQKECEFVSDLAVDDETAKSKNLAARITVPFVTTVAAGGLGYGITASVVKMKKENIKNEAAQKWMDEVGEHIQCYLGADELGSYGDVVSIELD